MEQMYNNKMQAIGYNQLVCDIFLNWEDVKDEILLPDRKQGTGNGTVHVFLGAADSALRSEFAKYYTSVEQGEDTSVQAVKIKHVFTKSNVLSMLGYVCQYYKAKGEDYNDVVNSILGQLETFTTSNGLITTESLFKLSTGSNKLRPYFKQFDDKGAFHKIIRLLLLPKSAYKISLYKNNLNEYAAFWLIGFSELNDFEADSSKAFLQDTNIAKGETYPLQQIFYGAPGTGKSHSVKTETEAWEERGRVVRTTFHPDSDYSTFVGAYKPTTESVQRYDIYNKPMTRDGVPVMEQIITYEFVGQAFLHAYIDAWKNREEPEFLIIEEINRGNCAQIFGDLFQLLDRGDDGYSEYAIKADKDLQKHLSKAFKEVEIEDFPNVKAGKELLLPNNLYIRATMNTSDQSLFPIDSAFKRRWDWKYRPISNAQLGWKIEADGMLYDWWEFLERINREIGTTTNSEDKKLGYFFCKAKEGRISAETFVGKVVFYLWNDVFKDYDLSNSFFDDGEGGKLTFDKFYLPNGNVNEEKIRMFLENIGMMPIDEPTEEEEEENEDESVKSNGKTIPKYSINGSTEQFTTPNAVQYIIENYAKQNENISVDEMIQFWNGIAERKNLLVPKWQPSPNDNQPFANKRRVEIKWGTCSAWLSKGWTEDLFKTFIQNVKQKLDINIARVN